VNGYRIVVRGAVATVFALASFGPLAGMAAAQEDTDVPPDDTTTSTSVVQEPDPEPTSPPPTQPQQPPPTQPQQPPPTVGPTTPTTATPPPTPTTQRPAPTTTRPPGTTTTRPPGTTTTRPPGRAPVIVFPTKDDGAVSSSTSAPGEVTAEPKTAVKTVPTAVPETTTTSDNPGEARVAGRTQDRGNGTGDLAASSFEDSSSSLLPSSTLGAMLLVAFVGFLAAGAYCAWLLVFARR
jgi:hypothetical protein